MSTGAELEQADEAERLLTPRFVLVVLVGLLYFLAVGALLPVTPLFVEGPLGGDSVAVGLATGAFFIGAVVLRPLAGRFGDRRGRRPLVIGGALVVAASIALYHLVGSVPALIGARLFGGLGEAAFFVGAGTMATDLAPEARRGEAISYWSVAIYGALAFGPPLGDAVLGDGRFGLTWTVAASLALAAGLLALATRETLEAPAASGVRQPLLHRMAVPPGIMLLLGVISVAGLVAFLPLYLAETGLADAGVVFGLYGALVLAVRVFGAKLPDKLGPLRAGTGAGIGVVVGMGVLALVPSMAGLVIGIICYAIGMSLMYPSLMLLALTDVPAAERGSVVGTVSTFFDLSQGLGGPVLGVVVALTGYRGAFAAAALLAGVGLILLRAGIDPRTREAVDLDAAMAAHLAVEPDPQ